MAEYPEHYQAVIADLKAKRARLDQLIAGIEAEKLVPTDASAVLDPTMGSGGLLATAIHPDTFFGLSIGEAAKKFLKMARRAQHTKAIADALAQGGMKRPTDNTMSVILIRAAKGREIVKVGKGMWGLSEWYPKSPKEPTDDRRKRPVAIRVSATKAASAKKAATRKKVSPVRQEQASQNGVRPWDVAMEVIRSAGKPLHATEIVKRINERGVAALRLPVEGFLNRQVKSGKVQKVGPSTFAMAG